MRQLLLLPLVLVSGLILIVIASGFQPGSTLHRESSRCLLIALWAAIPLMIVLPLAARWEFIRRKVLAASAFIAAGLLIGFSAYADSFTGYLILHLEDPTQHLDTLRRFKALHRVGFPMFLTIGLAVLWTISIRLARRRPSPNR
jgi:hypothetical protein